MGGGDTRGEGELVPGLVIGQVPFKAPGDVRVRRAGGCAVDHATRLPRIAIGLGLQRLAPFGDGEIGVADLRLVMQQLQGLARGLAVLHHAV